MIEPEIGSDKALLTASMARRPALAAVRAEYPAPPRPAVAFSGRSHRVRAAPETFCPMEAESGLDGLVPFVQVFVVVRGEHVPVLPGGHDHVAPGLDVRADLVDVALRLDDYVVARAHVRAGRVLAFEFLPGFLLGHPHERGQPTFGPGVRHPDAGLFLDVFALVRLAAGNQVHVALGKNAQVVLGRDDRADHGRVAACVDAQVMPGRKRAAGVEDFGKRKRLSGHRLAFEFSARSHLPQLPPLREVKK